MRRLKFQRQSVDLALIGVLILSMSLLGVLNSPAKAEDFAGEIVTGYNAALTGAFAVGAGQQSSGVKDYWKMNNHCITVGDKSYKVNVKIMDHKSDVSVAVSNYHHFAAMGAVVVHIAGTPFSVAAKPVAERTRIPMTVGGFSKKLFVPPSEYVFLHQPSYPGAVAAEVKWYKENVWKGSGKMRLGMLLWDNAYGRASDEDVLYDYLREDLGIELVPTAFFPTAAKDYTAQLLKLKSQEVNVIYFQALANQYAMFCKDAKRLKVTPKTDLLTTYWSLNENFPRLAGDAGNGAYGMWQYYVAKEDDNPSNPEVVKIHDAMEKYHGNRYWGISYFQGWLCQHLQAHMMKLAIKKYGFPITGEQVSSAAVDMGPWDWGLSRTFSGYRGGDRLGFHEQRIFQMKQGKIRVVSDWVPEPAGFLERAPWVVGK